LTTQPRYPRKRAPVPIRQGAFDVVANGKIPASVRNQIAVAQNTVGHYIDCMIQQLLLLLLPVRN